MQHKFIHTYFEIVDDFVVVQDIYTIGNKLLKIRFSNHNRVSYTGLSYSKHMQVNHTNHEVLLER